MDLARNWHRNNKFIGKTERAISVAQENTILAIAIVKKSNISDVCRWNHLEKNGTSN